MRYPHLFVIFILFFAPVQFVVAQQAIGVNPAETPPLLALKSYQEDHVAAACPLFREWREQYRGGLAIHFSQEQQETIFYAIRCGLRQAEPQAAQDALQFLAGSPIRAFQDRLRAALADYYFRTGQWADCIDQYTKAGIAHFNNQEISSAQFQQGYAHFVLQHYKEAAAFFNSVRSLPQGVHKIDATYYYALLQIKERNWDEALLQLRLVEFDSAYGPYTPYYIAQLLLSKGQRNEALSYVLSRQYQSPVPYHQKELQQLLGRIYFSQEQYAEALVQLAAYADKSQTLSREDAYQLAYCQYQTRDWSAAASSLRALSTQNDSLGQHAMFLLGDVYLKLGDLAAARSAFLFCSLNSSHSQQREAARFFHPKLSYQLGFFDEALSGLQSFMANYPSSSYLAEARELQLAVLAATSNYKEALIVLGQLSVPSEPARRLFAPVLYGRAAELINDGELENAHQLLDRALADPYNQSLLAYLLFWKGELAFRSQRYQEAVDLLEQYLQKGAPVWGEARPQNARYSLAYAQLRLGRYEQALSNFRSVSGQVESN
ncbi:MAG: tetratricopeptide repeat protein, partial [Sphingomonadales bacterium]